MPAVTPKGFAAATGAAAIAVAAAPAMTSGARTFSFAIMIPFYHQDQKLKTAKFQRNLWLS
jgi:hypothetical protein